MNHPFHQGNPRLGDIINFLNMINSGPTTTSSPSCHLPVTHAVPPQPCYQPPVRTPIHRTHYPSHPSYHSASHYSNYPAMPSSACNVSGVVSQYLPPTTYTSSPSPLQPCPPSLHVSHHPPLSPLYAMPPVACNTILAHSQPQPAASGGANSSAECDNHVGSSSACVPREKPYACSRCDMRFKSLLRLEEHVQSHERNDMRYACLQPGCSRTFVDHVYLQNHMKRHNNNEKPFDCEVCGKTFRQKAGLAAHQDIHDGKRPYQCVDCDKAFRQKTTLEQHRRMHTDERPYQCNFCDKAFRQRSHLDQHIRTHTGERPYQCGICVKSFKQKSGLDNHKRTHTGDKPYRCGVCGTTYKQRSGLINHLKTHDQSAAELDYTEAQEEESTLFIGSHTPE